MQNVQILLEIIMTSGAKKRKAYKKKAQKQSYNTDESHLQGNF